MKFTESDGMNVVKYLSEFGTNHLCHCLDRRYERLVEVAGGQLDN